MTTRNHPIHRRQVAVTVLAVALALFPSLGSTAASPDKNRFPSFQVGNGPLGYGKPDKVLTDVARWNHPAKRALRTLNEAKLVRVEYYLGGRYPVFFVEISDKRSNLRYLQLHETEVMDRYAKRVLKANAGWAFEIVHGEDRFRSNAAMVRGGMDAFQGPGDEDGFVGE
ncbi:MAG: hypothetical protein RIT45_4048 [Pseudomonadota bacterium]|jgi:hypothetical protein